MAANKEVTFRYLNQAELKSVGLDMSLALKVVEEVMRLHTLKKDVLPHKISMDLVEPERGRLNIMPGYIGGEFDAVGVKWIAIFPNNPQRYQLPSLSGLMILGDPDRGTPVAVVESSLITSLRTGAATGVAAKYLARQDSTSAAIIGAGVQGRTQLMALHQVLPQLKEARVYDVFPEAASRYADEMSAELGLPVRHVGSPQECVTGAQVVVTATVADEPIVKNAWLAKGCLFVHAGSNREEEDEVVLRSDAIFVDDWSGMLHRRSQTLARMHEDGLIDDQAISAELGQVILGQKPGRKSADERIYFCSVGMGTEDVALGYAAFRQAESKNVGTILNLFGS